MTGATKRILTGVKPTGVPHIGNYFGAIQPAVELSRSSGANESFLFLADLHALTIRPDPALLREETYAVAAAWLALGLDPERTVFYRQSDIPEIPFLAWVLSCSLPLGYLNRAHSFKDVQAKGTDAGDVLHGLYSYPVLMAADILLFDADLVPVGKDQKQHLEICQEAARKVNNSYGAGESLLKIPEALIDERVMTIPGLDGQKMSKSHGNTITPFMDEKELKKAVKSVVTDSTPYGQPLRVEGDVLLTLVRLLDPARAERLEASYRSGRKDPTRSDADLADPTQNYFGWGDAKKGLTDAVLERFASARDTYRRLLAEPAELERLLARGAAQARAVARPVLERVVRATGLTTRLPD